MSPCKALDSRSPAQSAGTSVCPVIVTLTDTGRDTILRHAQAAADGRETGGILLGHHQERPMPMLDVVHAGDAGPRAIRRADEFRRDVRHAQALADLAYSTDDSIWLGEWHTHLDGPAQPSYRDLASYRRVLGDPELAFHVFLSVIVLPDSDIGWKRPLLAGWAVSTAEAWPVPLLRRADLGRLGDERDTERRPASSVI